MAKNEVKLELCSTAEEWDIFNATIKAVAPKKDVLPSIKVEINSYQECSQDTYLPDDSFLM